MVPPTTRLKITRPVLPTVKFKSAAPSTVFWKDRLPVLDVRLVSPVKVTAPV